MWVKRDRAGSIASWSSEDTCIVMAHLEVPGYQGFLGTSTTNLGSSSEIILMKNKWCSLKPPILYLVLKCIITTNQHYRRSEWPCYAENLLSMTKCSKIEPEKSNYSRTWEQWLHYEKTDVLHSCCLWRHREARYLRSDLTRTQDCYGNNGEVEATHWGTHVLGSNLWPFAYEKNLSSLSCYWASPHLAVFCTPRFWSQGRNFSSDHLCSLHSVSEFSWGHFPSMSLPQVGWNHNNNDKDKDPD